MAVKLELSSFSEVAYSTERPVSVSLGRFSFSCMSFPASGIPNVELPPDLSDTFIDLLCDLLLSSPDFLH
jgi:hypothetical protein